MKMKQIAILVNTGNSSGRNLLRGILRFTTVSTDWDIRICDLADYGAERFLALIAEGRIDGVITSELEIPEIATALERSTVPLSVIGTREHALPARASFWTTVTVDEVAVGTMGAQTLLRYGTFNAFGFVGMRHDAYRYLSSLRERGFVQHIRKAGCEPILYDTGIPEPLSDESMLRAWVCALPKPAAILAACDARAEDVVRVAVGARLRVPGDVAVLGIDDDEFRCLSTSPTLSSIHLDFEEQGHEAACQLDRMLRTSPAGRHGARCSFAGHVSLVERGSTRMLAPGKALVATAKKFIAQNADRALTVEDVAAFTRVSPRLLFLRFREFSDKSIRETIAVERIRHFCKRLRTGDGTIGEIAARCGFRNMATLRALFTATTGQTIRAWRKHNSPT